MGRWVSHGWLVVGGRGWLLERSWWEVPGGAQLLGRMRFWPRSTAKVLLSAWVPQSDGHQPGAATSVQRKGRGGRSCPVDAGGPHLVVVPSLAAWCT